MPVGDSDFIGLPATLTFGPQENFKCVEITIVNNEVPEACERFVYQFSTQGGRVSLPSGSVLINDDDRESGLQSIVYKMSFVLLVKNIIFHERTIVPLELPLSYIWREVLLKYSVTAHNVILIFNSNSSILLW